MLGTLHHLGLSQALPVHARRLCSVLNAQPLKEISDVRVNRKDTDVERAGNRFVLVSVRHKCQDFFFTLCQLVEYVHFSLLADPLLCFYLSTAYLVETSIALTSPENISSHRC